MKWRNNYLRRIFSSFQLHFQCNIILFKWNNSIICNKTNSLSIEHLWYHVWHIDAGTINQDNFSFDQRQIQDEFILILFSCDHISNRWNVRYGPAGEKHWHFTVKMEWTFFTKIDIFRWFLSTFFWHFFGKKTVLQASYSRNQGKRS